MQRSFPIRAYHLYLPREYCDTESHAVGVAGCSSRPPTSSQGWSQYLLPAANSNHNVQAQYYVEPCPQYTPARTSLVALCNDSPPTCSNPNSAAQMTSSQLQKMATIALLVSPVPVQSALPGQTLRESPNVMEEHSSLYTGQ